MTTSLYVHIPFCENICAYCDFMRVKYHEVLVDKYLIRLKEDLDSRSLSTMKTIYIGGGTPNVLHDDQLIFLLEMLAPYANEVEEYSIECNVESLNESQIKILKQYGINRVSIGVQSLQTHMLSILHRSAEKKEIFEAIHLFHMYGIDNISIDLIYGLPNQTIKEWQEDLLQIAENKEISHISLYALTIEEHSEFGRMHVKNIDPTLEGEMYELAIILLEENGFQQYEISNFARGDKTSKHNQVYWNYEDYAAIGCGASGKEKHSRYDMTHNINSYIKNIEVRKSIPLTKEEEMFEMIMMNLRMVKGMNITKFNQLFDVDFMIHYQKVLEEAIQKQFITIKDEFIKTTTIGLHFLNDVLLLFM